MKKIYIIEYTVKSKNDVILKTGKIKVKNKLSELDAKIKLEQYLQKKYSDFNQLIIHNCNIFNPLSEIFGDTNEVNDIFKHFN